MLPIPPTPSEDKPGASPSSTRDSSVPDLVGLVVLLPLWVFAFTIGPHFGYLPPRFKSPWLHNLALVIGFAAWIGLGIVLLIFRNGMIEAVLGVGVILAGVCGLGFVFLQEKDKEEKQTPRGGGRKYTSP